MSILDEVLKEEYDRCERIKALYNQELAAASSEDVRQNYRHKIAEVEFDQRKICAALAVAGIEVRAQDQEQKE